jgi:phosphomannomutase
MSLIKSISGIRGVIGGKAGDTLSPLDVVRFTASYGTWLLRRKGKTVVIGRDGRISGKMIQSLVINTLISLGLDVIDVGLSTTPTVEMAILFEKASGGIIITASHNTKEWNALKLLNENGEFISKEDGEILLDIAKKEDFIFASIDKLGMYKINTNAIEKHINSILTYPLVNVKGIKELGLKVVIDTINSTGSISIPPLLTALGIKDIIVINSELNGNFAHNPEPLPENLTELCNEVKKHKADLGIAVDPDVDRVCFVCEDGSLFGEEYSLVAVADYVLKFKKGTTVSNMSSTKALKDITNKHESIHISSCVGEVNVVSKMKEVKAIIGGEGNGGIILPDLHYGRDALIGIALFLSHLALEKKTTKELRNTYPNYYITKKKINIKENIIEKLINKYKDFPINTEDGLKIDLSEDSWIHIRISNTEPIMRIYAESKSEIDSENIAKKIIEDIDKIYI